MEWLTQSEHEAWVGLLVTAGALQHLCDRHLQADAGISFQTYSVLAALSGRPDATIHMGELSGITGHSQSRLSHAIARMERDGLVRRAACPADKRAVHVLLTDAGDELVRRAAPAHVATVRRLAFDHLTAQQTRALAEATRTLWAALVPEGTVPPASVLGAGGASGLDGVDAGLA